MECFSLLLIGWKFAPTERGGVFLFYIELSFNPILNPNPPEEMLANVHFCKPQKCQNFTFLNVFLFHVVQLLSLWSG